MKHVKLLVKFNETGKLAKKEVEYLEKFRASIRRDLVSIDYILDKKILTVPCDGEAHSNINIDNCMRCAPRWGVLPDPNHIEHAEKEQG